ncbi:MAG: hypothetical protein ACI8WT_003859 [Clostridium sp.]|jgi:hypothetical protein
MSITRDKFIPRPGIVNIQGHLPDPSELVCVELPKVFDQCLIKRCLVYDCGPDTLETDTELRSDVIGNSRVFIGCRDFHLKLISVEKFPLKKNPSYKKIIVCFKISFFADYINCSGETMCEFFQVKRTEVISKLYCPDSIAQTSATFSSGKSNDIDCGIVKLELVAECLDGVFCTNDCCETFLDITLGFHLIVKCELVVQLLIPAFGYCPVPYECDPDPYEDPCDQFDRSPVPKFFPDQKLKPLFDDESDDDE